MFYPANHLAWYWGN